MVRILYLLSVFVLLAAGNVFMLCVPQWSRDDAKISAVLTARSAVETFMEGRNRHPDNTGEIASPLLVQAQIFASYLNPAQPAKEIASAAPRFASRSSSSAPAIRPPAPTMRFKLHGTSYYPNQPERSMALIWEPVGVNGTTRWVKEGTQLGHFVVHEIKRGVVVFQDGEQLLEMSVEHTPASRSLVRGTRSGTRQLSAIMNESGARLPPPAGPNGIEVSAKDGAAWD